MTSETPTSESTLDDAGESPREGGGRGLPHIISSLRHRNYRLFFFGQMVSTLGTWMQQPAMQWLVWEMKKSEIMSGALTAAGAIPITLLSSVGGLVAERFDRRRILLVTQPLLMLPPLCLAVALLLDPKYEYVRVWHLMAAAALHGTIMAFDVPARQSFVVKMVGRADIPNAIALNSFVFNLSRTLGPMVGTLLFLGFGAASCFGGNALSYIALISGLLMMRMPSARAEKSPRASLRHPLGGFYYVGSRRDVAATMVLLAAGTIFGWSLTSQLPAFTEKIFHQHKGVFGGFLSVFGAGALVGALILARLAGYRNRRRLILIGLVTFTAAVVVFTYSRHYSTAMVPVFFAGMGLLMAMSGINSHIQMQVSERFRGRVMGVYAMFFGGMMPVGSLFTGFMAEKLSLPLAVQINVAALLLVTIGVAVYWRRVLGPGSV